MRWVIGDIHNAGDFADATVVPGLAGGVKSLKEVLCHVHNQEI